MKSSCAPSCRYAVSSGGARRTRAMTLLETVLAMSLLSMIALTGAQAVRMSWQAWDVQDRRSDMLQHLSGVLTHITRQVRSARGIVDVSNPTDLSGNLEITLPDDSVVKWYHDGADATVRYEIGGNNPGELVATGIDSLTFECFELDGVTPTTVVDDIRMIRVTTSVTIPVQGTSFPLSATIWIRKQRDGVAPTYIDFYALNSAGGGVMARPPGKAPSLMSRAVFNNPRVSRS